MSIIEKGYKIFSNYNIADIENVCTACCVNEDEVFRLVNTNVKNISHELLTHYNDAAQAYNPKIREFKHFLPRYLELIYNFEFPSLSLELSLRNIPFYDKADWTEEEWIFLNEYMIKFFKKCLGFYPIPDCYMGFSPILIMLNKAGYNIETFLEIWKKDDSYIGCMHYKTLLVHDFAWMKKSKIGNAFSNTHQSEIIYKWSHSESVKKKFIQKMEKIILGDYKLEELGDCEIEESDMKELNWIYEILEMSMS